MRKLYEKNELRFAIAWIVVYCVLQSLANPLNKAIGIGYAASAAFCILQTVVLFTFIRKNGLQQRYGLCRPSVPAGRFLYYVPPLILASGNLWNGVAVNYAPAETACRIVCMLCVGFLEEVIFRGFLFKALCRTSVKQAVVISSVTFGIGHIVNLLNGRDIPETILQICYAVAIGFQSTILFLRGKSLWPCILTHSAINSLSAFANAGGAPAWHGIAGSAFLCLVSLAYVWYILRATKKEPISHE